MSHWYSVSPDSWSAPWNDSITRQGLKARYGPLDNREARERYIDDEYQEAVRQQERIHREVEMWMAQENARLAEESREHEKRVQRRQEYMDQNPVEDQWWYLTPSQIGDNRERLRVLTEAQRAPKIEFDPVETPPTAVFNKVATERAMRAFPEIAKPKQKSAPVLRKRPTSRYDEVVQQRAPKLARDDERPKLWLHRNVYMWVIGVPLFFLVQSSAGAGAAIIATAMVVGAVWAIGYAQNEGPKNEAGGPGNGSSDERRKGIGSGPRQFRGGASADPGEPPG